MWNSNKKSTVKIPSNPRSEFYIKNFSGGLNNTDSASRLKDNESPDLLNINFAEDGTLTKRSGLKLVDWIKMTEKSDMLTAFEIKQENNKSGFLLHCSNGKALYDPSNTMYYITSTGKVKKIPLNNPYTQGFSGCHYMDKFFFCAGGLHLNFMYISDLENKTDIPIYLIKDPPDGFTPKPKPAMTGVVKKEMLNGDPLRWNIWYEPCQYEIEDGYKGYGWATFSPTMITTLKDRLYVSGSIEGNYTNTIFISDILNPLYFPGALTVNLPPDGDLVTGLHVFNDALVVARKNDLHVLSGNTNKADNAEAYLLRHINSHTGMPNKFCADIINSFLFFVGSDGNCYKLSTALYDSTNIKTQMVNEKIDFTLPPFNHKLSDVQKAHTGYDSKNSEWYIQIGDDTFIYNFKLMAWTRYRGVECKKFIATDGAFYLVKDNCMFYEFAKDVYYDYSSKYKMNIPIYSYWQSKDIDFGQPTKVKQVRDTYIVSETFDHVPTSINVLVHIDYVDISTDHVVESQKSFWDEAKWDVNKFIGYNINRSLPMMIGRRGRNFSFKVSNQGHFMGVYTAFPDAKTVSEMEYGSIFCVKNSLGTKFYKRVAYNLEYGNYIREITEEEMFQPMKVYEFNGIYELKGYR